MLAAGGILVTVMSGLGNYLYSHCATFRKMRLTLAIGSLVVCAIERRGTLNRQRGTWRLS